MTCQRAMPGASAVSSFVPRPSGRGGGGAEAVSNTSAVPNPGYSGLATKSMCSWPMTQERPCASVPVTRIRTRRDSSAISRLPCVLLVVVLARDQWMPADALASKMVIDIDWSGNSSACTGVATSATRGPISSAIFWSASRSKP